MQIEGKYHSGYHSYSKTDYHYTGGSKEEEQEVRREEHSGHSMGKWQGDSGVIVELSSHNTYGERQASAGQETESESTVPFLKKGVDIFQGFWKSLEEDDKSETMNTIGSKEPVEADEQKLPEDIVEEAGGQRGVSTVVSEIKQFFSMQIADKVNALIEKLKVGIQTALKRFGKDSEPFGALTDPGTGSLLGGKAGSEGKGKRRESGQGQETNMKAKPKVNEHLMDSYSKSGKYCKINENLTYQQGRAPYKVSEKMPGQEGEDSF